MLLSLAAVLTLLPTVALQCQYRNGYIFECGHNHLNRMSQLRGPVPAAVSVLDISYNQFEQLDPEHLMAEFPGVRQLLAVDNRIARIAPPPADTSATWQQLRLLKLSRNRFESVGRDEFSFGTGLEALHLDENRLQSLSRGCFSRCHNLSLLNLAHNNLDYLHSDYFWGLWSLRQLQLSHNQLTGLPSDAFGHLHSLEVLDLGRNRIKSVSAAALRGLPNLRSLSLAGNQLAEFPLPALKPSQALRHLDLSGNHLADLYAGSVASLPALESLLLNNSAELRLDAGAFQSLPRLSLLDVADSHRLVYISASAFSDCPRLSELRLSDCPLAVAPLADWRRNSPQLDSVIGVSDATPTGAPPGTGSGSGGDVMVMDLFPAEIILSEGHRLKLPCRSYPEGRARWQLPASLASGSEQRRHLQHHVTVTPGQDLLLHDAFDRLSGTYVCAATGDVNETSSQTSSGSSGRQQRREVTISVKRMESRLLLLKLTENSIVVTWQHLANLEDFVLMYRPRGDTDTSYHRIRLRAYMKRYSISSLRPGSAYQLCLALRTYTDYQHLHCMLVTTLTGRESDRDNLLFNGRIVLVLVVGIAVSVGVLIACLVACSLSRDKETDAWSQASLAGSRWSDSQPMTFENRAAADDYFGEAGDALDSDQPDDDEQDEEFSAGDQIDRLCQPDNAQTAGRLVDGIELQMQQHEAASAGEFDQQLVTSAMQHNPPQQQLLMQDSTASSSAAVSVQID